MRVTYWIIVMAMFLLACSRVPGPSNSQPPSQSTQAVATAGVQSTSGASGQAAAGLGVPDDHVIGAPGTFDNLTVYPITSATQVDVGPLVALEDALRQGQAEVRELGADSRLPDPHTSRIPGSDGSHIEIQAANQGGGAQVNTLVIENKGSVPVFVLAGTVVKGGKQDRQIGQDFIISAKQTVPVDAFCVEHGRWNGSREGQATEGKFGSSEVIATSKVRAAGQYKKNQSEVWAKVGETNAANRKAAASGTLMATLDDAELKRRRTDLALKIDAFLAGVKPDDHLVGMAYAIDGQVRGARWFVHHKLFQMHRNKLVQSTALDAITAQAEAQTAGRAAYRGAQPKPGDVDKWIKDVDAQALAEKRDTAAANENEYRESASAYGSKLMLKPAAAPAAAQATTHPPSPSIPLSRDYLSK